MISLLQGLQLDCLIHRTVYDDDDDVNSDVLMGHCYVCMVLIAPEMAYDNHSIHDVTRQWISRLSY